MEPDIKKEIDDLLTHTGDSIADLLAAIGRASDEKRTVAHRELKPILLELCIALKNMSDFRAAYLNYPDISADFDEAFALAKKTFSK